jgi:hypothetical protein
MTSRSSGANTAMTPIFPGFSRGREYLRRLDSEETRAAVRTLIGAGIAEAAVARLLAWHVNDVRRAAAPDEAAA